MDAPSGASNPEGRDMGQGLIVLEEQPSHGRDSSNMSGHAIPAMLYGNQCAVLYDSEPTGDEFLHGEWIVITFDLLGLF